MQLVRGPRSHLQGIISVINQVFNINQKIVKGYGIIRMCILNVRNVLKFAEPTTTVGNKVVKVCSTARIPGFARCQSRAPKWDTFIQVSCYVMSLNSLSDQKQLVNRLSVIMMALWMDVQYSWAEGDKLVLVYCSLRLFKSGAKTVRQLVERCLPIGMIRWAEVQR